MKLLIDADSAPYRAGFANEERRYDCIHNGKILDTFKYIKDAKNFQEFNDCEVTKASSVGELGLAKYNLEKCVSSMFAIKHDSYEMYIGGKGNFRYDYFPEYKQNRKDTDKPAQLADLLLHLELKYKAIRVDGEEADDKVSYRQMQCLEAGVQSCIVSIDKDLNNTPGWHYNWVKELTYYVTKKEADLFFARQLLTGDSTDGIPGLKGVGKKTAERILPSYTADWLDIVKREYVARGYDMDYLTIQGIMLWMRRKPDEVWSC